MTDPISTEGDLKHARRQRRTQREAPVDRLPPHSPEAELGVLGCIMLAPKESISECVAKFKGNAEVFYDLRHQTIYHEMVTMWDEQRLPETITLMQRLKDKGLLEKIGGIEFISALADTVPSAAQLPEYIRIVWEKYLLRKAIRACGQAVSDIYDFEGNVEELLDTLEADILAVNENRSSSELLKMGPLMGKAIDLVENMHRGVGLISGIRTRFGYLDKMTGGLHNQELVVIAGRPSLGKTSLAMNLAQNIASVEKIPVGVFSMEMSALDLCLRMWCAEAMTDFHKIRTGFISHEAMQQMSTCVTKVSRLPLYIDDTAALSILELRAKARRMAHQWGVKLFVVDYLQLMHSTSDRAHNREQEIADISNGLKALAKELDVPVVALCQLNREAEKRKYTKPQLSDLRESGAIEQDADLVGILYRPQRAEGATDTYGAEFYDGDGDEIRTNLHIAKQRNGPTGDVELLFKRWCMKFEDAYQNRGKVL